MMHGINWDLKQLNHHKISRFQNKTDDDKILDDNNDDGQ
jgi:hypothetical protein